MFGEYNSGERNFTANSWIDPEEVGKGKTKFLYQNIKAGLRFSWYRNDKTARRDHIQIGIIEEVFTGYDDKIRVEHLDMEEEALFFKDDPQFYQGFTFQWNRDHTHKLFLEIYPKYAHTGEITSSQVNEDGGVFVQIGFLKSLDQWLSAKKK